MGNCQNFSEDDSKKATSKLKRNPQVTIRSYTWPRDSHGLFDYECKNVNKRQIKTTSPGKLMRSGSDVVWVKESDNPTHPNANDKDLMKLALSDGNAWISSCYEATKTKKTEKDNKNHEEEDDLEHIDDNLWMVIRSLKSNTNNKGYKLVQGDLIKLGRVKFRIKEVKTSPYEIIAQKKPEKISKEEEPTPAQGLEKKDSQKGLDSSLKSSKMCRICLFENSEPDDPFLSPCNCSGTMKYIHIKCLQHWLKSKLNKKVHGHCTSIYWKSFECELCKKAFPGSIEVDKKKYDLIEIEKPECAYIILEILSKEKNISRGLHVIKMETKTNIRLGRGHDSDIRITDISVSRCHALIKLEKGSFYIEDNNSKFGTLVYLKKPLLLTGEYGNCQVQIGRTLLSFSVKKNWKMLPACFSSAKGIPNKSRDDEENNQNADSEDEIYIDHLHNLNNGDIHINNNNNNNHSGGEGEIEPDIEGEGIDDLDIGLDEQNPYDEGNAQSNNNNNNP